MPLTQHFAQDVQPYGPAERPHQLSWPTAVIAGSAALKLLTALLLITPLAPAVDDDAMIGSQTAIRSLPWLLPAVVLLLANGRQFRTASLGVAMLLFASRFSTNAIELLAVAIPAAALLINVVPGVFMPYYLGKFLLEFPQPRTGPSARWLTAATRLALGIGVVQFLALLSRGVTRGWQLPFAYRFITGAVDTRVGPMTMFILSLLILGLSFARLRGLLPEDRRRQQRLFAGWALLMAPLSLWLVQYVLAGPNQAVPATHAGVVRLLITFVGTLSVLAPSLIAYRVLEGRPWQVREAVRRGVNVALDARLLAIGAIAPLAVFAGVAYAEQNQSVSAVFSRAALGWLVISAMSAAMLFWREQLVRAFNRWFFREHYDADEMLFELTSWMRQSHGIDELVAHLTSGIDRALRPYRVVVLVRDESATQFVPLFGSAEPMPASALLVELLSAGQGVLDTPLAGGTSPMRWLPQDERYWLVDCGARLIVPLRASDGSLNGLIAVGDRKSGRPYAESDRRWLTAIAESASITIEAHSTPSSEPSAETAMADTWRVGLVQRHTRALECERCGHIDEASAAGCRQCGAALGPSLVPHLLFGKFRFEQRIGRGGMGVVYRATDLALERPVAVKMLPGATPEYSELLRLEARSMAAVTHRHLAVVYGVEGWRGQPLLICEYMERGTLAEQLTRGPLAPQDALALGVALADALAVIHERRLLHRDIKPSNIGFDHAGVPKLLDFGLAQLLSSSTQLPQDLRPEVRAAGTPLYMSPEAVSGLPPTPSIDLWGLHVLLYEAIAGRHPFRRETTEETLRAIARDPAPPLAPAGGLPPDQSARLASYFANALAKDAARRPGTAADTAVALRSLMS